MKLAAARFCSRWYVTFVLFLWVFAPEIRRISDWQTGFSFLPIINLLPLVALLPGLFLYFKTWSSLGKIYRAATLLWLVGFAYAFVIAFAYGQLFAAAYDVAVFMLPMCIGPLLVISSSRGMAEAYERVAAPLLWLAALASVYGIYQYVAPPPWDVYWVQSTKLVTLGDPVPFGLRIFGPLNLAGTLADFLTLAILINLPRLRPSQPLRLALVAPCLIALILTLVRADWIGLSIGVAIYALFSPKRTMALASIAMIVAVCAVGAGLLLGVVHGSDSALQTVSDRFSTFNDLGNDHSVMSRQDETADALAANIREPLGQGLGSIGTSTKLGEAGAVTTLDNGYLSRFTEMGLFGVALYVATLFVALIATLTLQARYSRQKATAYAALVAAMIAVEAMLLFADGSADHHLALTGVFFWLAIYFVSRGLEEQQPSALRFEPRLRRSSVHA